CQQHGNRPQLTF
nr:immunoglobulin light chain junction region [Macaca mulatta]MPN90996.1 immunoglobulin light chain junction region [Macaca mulatta]MPN91089.1 immunoglobulin light chain junction region [Macaca mulatta]MPN91148.1 immunoglobulin light chain junction region [Macaca mulatta]MPN91189.1 immunoglobulin light chain junction region [Macaca mulatta]